MTTTPEFDYYEALGVDRNADLTEIKRSYRKLMRQHHPDLSPGPESEEICARATIAYAVLENEEKRAEYDRMLDGEAQPGDTYYEEPEPEVEEDIDPEWGDEISWEETAEDEPAADSPADDWGGDVEWGEEVVIDEDVVEEPVVDSGYGFDPSPEPGR